MGVIIESCFYLGDNDRIIKISCDTSEEQLVQGVTFNVETGEFLKVTNRKSLFSFDLKNGISKGNTLLIQIPIENTLFSYRINNDNSVTRVNHLYIETESGKKILLVNESIESYKNILSSIPDNLVSGLFIKLNGVYIPYRECEILKNLTV